MKHEKIKQFFLKKYPKSRFDDCPVPKHYWDIMQEYAESYHAQFKQPDIGEDVENNVSIVRRLEDIMSQFGEAHNMLAKTSLSKDEYQPISSLLATTKIGLFNIYNELKNKITWAHKVESRQPIPTVDEDDDVSAIEMFKKHEHDISKDAETEFELLLMIKNELLSADKLPFTERHEATIKILESISITRK